MALPTVQCFAQLPGFREQLAAIYEKLYINAGMPDDLPAPECVLAMPGFREQLTAIYAALLAGGGGGGITSGDNWRFSGAGNELQFLNLDTGLFNPLYTAGVDGSQTIEIQNGE